MHEVVKDTVTENCNGIIVHDHDVTFYNYGTNHQECQHLRKSLILKIVTGRFC